MSPTAAAGSGWRAVHVLLSLEPLSQHLRKSCCPWTWKQDHSTSNKLCSFEGLGSMHWVILFSNVVLVCFMTKREPLWIQGTKRSTKQALWKAGHISRDWPNCLTAITKILLKHAEKRSGKTEVVCFYFTAEPLVNKDNCLRKKIGVCHLCDPLSEHAIHGESLFQTHY